MQYYLNWTDEQLLNSAISVLAKESGNGVKRNSCRDEKYRATVNMAQKCHCTLRKG